MEINESMTLRKIHSYNKKEDVVLPKNWGKVGEWVVMQTISEDIIIVHKMDIPKILKEKSHDMEKDDFIKWVEKKSIEILKEKEEGEIKSAEQK